MACLFAFALAGSGDKSTFSGRALALRGSNSSSTSGQRSELVEGGNRATAAASGYVFQRSPGGAGADFPSILGDVGHVTECPSARQVLREYDRIRSYVVLV
eukprot:7391124-Prymnesium_polylepis.1